MRYRMRYPYDAISFISHAISHLSRIQMEERTFFPEPLARLSLKGWPAQPAPSLVPSDVTANRFSDAKHH